MVQEVDVVYCLIKRENEETLKVGGTVVEAKGDTVVLAAPKNSIKGVPNSLLASAPGEKAELAFVRVPANSLSSVLPAGWSAKLTSRLPKKEVCLAAWGELEKEVLVSSGAERPTTEKPPPRVEEKPKSSLAEDLARMKGLWDQSESSESEESDFEVRQTKKESRFLPPGGSGQSRQRDRGRSSREEDPMQKMMEQAMSAGIAEGKSSSDLLPLLMMGMFMKDAQKNRSRKSRTSRRNRGGSSSESSSSSAESDNKGMKAVHSLHRMQKRVKHHPRKICREFEAEVIRELGIVEGQPWTLQDWVKKQSWGKYKGIYRCALMDVAAYELIRSGQVESGAAQLVQNLKAKLESVLQMGDWQSAWLLTGLSDPMQKKEFGGSKQEMSIIAQYVNSLGKLRKHVKEAKQHGHAEEDGEDAVAGKHK